MKNTILSLRILYPLWAIVGMYSLLYVQGQLIHLNNPALTAQKIIENDFLFRTGIMGSLITQLLFVIIAWLLYKLFENVNKSASQWMVILAFVSIPITMLNEINQYAVLLNTGNITQMMFFINLHQFGMSIASIFWGLWLFPLGYLVYKSGYFPKWVGFALYIGGLGYLIAFIIKILFPSLKPILSYTELFTFGEVVWMLWLSIAGVKKSQAIA
ncbi:MAG: hypothetical protein RLZZ175_2908 [Bacteroidota bacterium]|jgi:hypothetical protein